jgi:two-component system, chemotaxis family, chemotaxis protein CheY
MAILVVDDELDIRESLQELFEDAGYQVATAADGAEALALMQSGEAPCVVILDLIMPGVNGNEVYSVMQCDERLSDVPVIVATSDPSRAPRDVAVLRKPIDTRRLLEAVRRHCRG